MLFWHLPVFLLFLSDGFTQPNISLLYLHRDLFGPHVESSGEQLPNVNVTLTTTSRSFIRLISHRVAREQTTPGYAAGCQQFFPYFYMSTQNEDVYLKTTVIPDWLMLHI